MLSFMMTSEGDSILTTRPRFTISITYRASMEPQLEWTAFGVEHASGETLVEALSKFLLIVAGVQERIDKVERPSDEELPPF